MKELNYANILLTFPQTLKEYVCIIFAYIQIFLSNITIIAYWFCDLSDQITFSGEADQMPQHLNDLIPGLENMRLRPF